MELREKEYGLLPDEQLSALAKASYGSRKQYQPSCSGFVCSNTKLREYIA